MKRITIVALATLAVSLFWVAGSRPSSVNTTAIYNTSGTEQTGEHIIMGTATLAAGTATITLAGKAVFSSSSSYVCTTTDATGLNVSQVVKLSGSSFTVNGVLTDSIQFVCVGN
jgi:hypothetical protein